MIISEVDITKRVETCYTEQNVTDFCNLVEASSQASKRGEFQTAWESRGKILEILGYLNSCVLTEEQKNRCDGYLKQWSTQVALKQGYESYCLWLEAIKDLHFHTPIIQAAMSNYYVNTGRFQEALNAANSAKQQAFLKQQWPSYAEALNLLSVIYFYQGDAKASIEAANEALALGNLEKRLYVNLYRNVATAELMRGEISAAMEAVQKAVNISIEASNIPLELSTQIRHGVCLAHAERFQEALAIFDRCLELDKQSCKDPEAYQPSIKIVALKELCMERARRKEVEKPPFPEKLAEALKKALEEERMPIFKIIVLVNLYRLYTFYEKVELSTVTRAEIEALKEEELKELGDKVYSPPLFGWDLLPVS